MCQYAVGALKTQDLKMQDMKMQDMKLQGNAKCKKIVQLAADLELLCRDQLRNGSFTLAEAQAEYK